MLKDLAIAKLLRNQMLAIWNFIWYIIQDPFEFFCNMIIVELLFWTCDLWSSSVTWSYWSCYFEPVSNAYFWSHLIHEKTKKIVSYGFVCLDVAIFIWCLALHIANFLLIIAWFKVQRESGFSIWHSCLLDCILLVRSF